MRGDGQRGLGLKLRRRMILRRRMSGDGRLSDYVDYTHTSNSLKSCDSFIGDYVD
jgi:hypothetical protein